MINFKDLNIQPLETKGFTGDKVSMNRVLNREISVLDFKIEDSKIVAGQKCLHLHIELGITKHVIFTGSKSLMEILARIPKDSFPFKTTITEDNKRFSFN